MMNSRQSRVVFCLCLATLIGGVARAQSTPETFTATASLKTAGGTSSTSPMTVTVSSFATDSDRDALVGAVKSGGTKAAKGWLAKRPNAGTIQVGAQKGAIKYAYARATGSGRLITIATAEPIALVGAGLPGAKSPEGFELALLLLEVPASGAGKGELAPAAKVRVNQDGAIVTEDFAAGNLVAVTNVAKK